MSNKELIRNTCKDLGISQIQLADMIGVKPNNISTSNMRHVLNGLLDIIDGQ